MPSKSKIRERRRVKSPLFRSQRSGAIIVLFAILLPLMVLILGFTVDYAYMQRSRNEVRVVSDLAARAAADTLARTGGDETAALAAARLIALNNSVAGENITLRDEQIVFGRSYKQPDGSYSYFAGDAPANAVQVIARRDDSSVEGPISTFFGATYGRPTFNVAELAQSTFRDVQVVLVLDRSASMKFPLGGLELSTAQRHQRRDNLPQPDSRWKALDNAVEVFLTELESTPVQEKVGLVTFANSSTLTIAGESISIESSSLDSPLSQNLERVRSQMDERSNTIWFGGTNVTAGLEEARQHFASEGSGNVDKIIICLTDGVHNASGVDDPEVAARRCFDDGITVHTITFSNGADEAGMRLTAESGGGNHNHAPDEETLSLIFKRLAGSASFLSK